MNDKKLRIEIDELPPMYNVYLRKHYRQRTQINNYWRWLIFGELKNLDVPFEIPLERYTFSMTRVSTSEPDYDGLVGSGKLISDIFQKLGITKDDKLSNTGVWDCQWRKTRKRKDQKIIIEITPRC